MSKSLIKLIAINLVFVLLLSIPLTIANAAGINITGYEKLKEGENSYVTHKSYFTPTSTNYYNIVVATPEWLKIYDADTGDEVTSIKSGNFSGVNLWGHYVGGVYSLEKDKNYVVDFTDYYELGVYITNMNYKKISTGESYVGEKTVYFKPGSSDYFHVVISTPEALSVYELGTDKKIQPLISGNQCGRTFAEGSTSYTNGGVYYFEKGTEYTFDFVGDYSYIYIRKPDYIPAPNIANESKAGVYCISTPDNCAVYAYNTTVMDENGLTPAHDGNLYPIEGYKDYLIKINEAETYGDQQTLAPGFVMGGYYFKNDFVVKENAGGTYDLYDYLGDDDNVEVPNNFNGKQVTTVQSGAFEKRNFNSIILPNSLTTIKYDAFSYVTNINYLGIDENTSVIEPYAFDTFNINHIYYGNTQSYWGNICESNVYCPVHYEATYWDGYFTAEYDTEKCHVTEYSCDYCDKANFKRDLGDGSRHSTQVIHYYNEPKCYEGGAAKVKCTHCGLEFDKELPQLEHQFENYVNDNNATCFADGTETAKCKWCDETDTRTAIGTVQTHKFENYISNNDATCQKNATETGKCKWCNTPNTREIANSKAEHKFENYVSDNNATCCDDGTKTAKCKWCDEKDTVADTGSAKGHIDSSKVFTDVPAGKWFKTYVDYTVSHGIFTGTSKDTFSPNDNITRAQFVQVLANLEGVDTSNRNVKTQFSDVPAKKWYTAAVKWASDNKIVNGVGNGKFDPNANVTREQMCLMLVNYAKFKTITLKTVEAKENFADDASISKWAKDAVYTCQQADIVNGKGAGKFDPQGTGTRAEASVIFTKFHQGYMK